MSNVVMQKTDGAVLLDRRGYPRKKTNRLATISIKNSYVCRCVIKDISLTGAKLAVPEHSWIPDNFKMICPDGEYSLEAAKIWSKNGFIGVKFKLELITPDYD
ncbi:MAG: PilZ domain-containing protein [Pseudomonadota bacterium]